MDEAPLSEAARRALLRLFPTAVGRPDAASWLVDQLVDAERHRRGEPDAVSRVFHALALTQGSLLREEYDLNTHGHADGWVLGAVVVDPRELIRVNMDRGFPAGDAALRAIAAALTEVLPTAKVVRVHSDAFAALLGPTSGLEVSVAQLGPVRAALDAHLGALDTPLAFTLGALELTVVDPPSWQVLGPLVWAEVERALVIFRRLGEGEVLRRRVVLDGRLPELP
jgi:GGDEF domain-containing protein